MVRASARTLVLVKQRGSLAWAVPDVLVDCVCLTHLREHSAGFEATATVKFGGINAAKETVVNPDRIIRRTAKLVEAMVDGELVALDTRKGSCYGFNASATRIWALAEHPISLSDLCANLTREFAVAPEQCMREIAEVIGQLEDDGLVEVVPQNLP